MSAEIWRVWHSGFPGGFDFNLLLKGKNERILSSVDDYVGVWFLAGWNVGVYSLIPCLFPDLFPDSRGGVHICPVPALGVQSLSIGCPVPVHWVSSPWQPGSMAVWTG